MNSISLSGDWRLYYHPEDGPLPGTPREIAKAGWARVDAKVPGNVELDLVRAGVEEDPFYGENLYAFRKYEFYQWWYMRSFFVPADFGGHRCVIRFHGLDTCADVFVNDIPVGSTDNMFIGHELDVTQALLIGEENRIAVRIRSAVNEARKKDYPVALSGCEGSDEYTRIRKAPSSFGWDIMPRLVSAGIWREVELVALPEHRLTQVYLSTQRLDARGDAQLDIRVRFETEDVYLDGFTVRVEGRCGDSAFECEKTAMFVSLSMGAFVPQAKLWWPKGYGEQPLYDVKVTLLHHGRPVDEWNDRIGIRWLELDTRWEPGDAGEFRILCNGVPILAKGSNWVPMDAMHSRDAGRVKAALELFDEAGCNIVRCWGGNVYEDHSFFDLCDEMGIMVWQDFAMACAIYSPDEEFVRAIEKEAVSVVRKLRNHPSILLWAGDNEVDSTYPGGNYPTYSNCYNAITREVLPRVIRMEDPHRVFLPSSPYMPEGMDMYLTPEQHNWGARAYFKDDFYKHTTAHFISECGYHGCPPVSSLRKYIPEEQLTPWLNNSAWDTHNTDYLLSGQRGYNRIQLMHDQVAIYFGSVPEDLETFSILSQIVQAEAKKFFIERTRIKKWRRTGIIWWNMIDGWPQISDAVVDYYYAKKLAFHYIKRVQQPICLMMDELVDWGHEVVLGNDSRETKNVAYRIEDGETGEVLLEGSVVSPANENVSLGSIREMAGAKKLYLMTWEVDGVQYANHFISGFPHFDAEKMLQWVEIIRALPGAFELTE